MRVQSLIDALEQGTIMAESGGNPNAVHPLVKRGQYAGQRAIGLLGIMPGNVPGWSREHLGREMTPAELAADEEAQKRIFRGEMQKHLAKGLSPQDASSIWFTGRPFAQAKAAGANDSFTGVQDYVAKVTGMGVPTRSVPTTQEGPAAMPMQNPFGGLGGLGGYQPPTGMQTFGDILSALGMSMLSSPSNNMFQALPQTYTAIQGRRGKEADRAREEERWATEFGLRKQDLEARRAEQAIDNARQERALKVTEGNAATSAKTEMQRLMELNHPDLKPGTQAYFDAYKAIKQAGVSGETFGAPTFVNRGGKTYAVQYGSQGTVKENEVSGELNKPEQTTRLGTKVRIRNADGSISYEDIDVAGEAAGKVQGKFSGEQLAEAPGNLSRIQAARQELAGIKADPRRAGTTGWWAGIGGHNIPATDAYDFANKVAKAKAGAFTQGLQALKGFGPVTELEGKTAAKAVERMELASSDREFETALDEYEAALAAAEEKVQRVLQGRANPAPMTPRPGAGSGGPGRVRYDANGNRM
jgi:hypothetical protein